MWIPENLIWRRGGEWLEWTGQTLSASDRNFIGQSKYFPMLPPYEQASLQAQAFSLLKKESFTPLLLFHFSSLK